MKFLVFLITALVLGTHVSYAAESSVYERVMKTGVIECGYFIEPPFTIKDEKTGEFSGLAVDLAEAVASELGLTLKWKEQISFATFPEDLNHNKYDMVCGSVFVLPRGGKMDYSSPYAYVSMEGYVKKGNQAFNQAFDKVDWSKVTIAGLDGEGATTAAQKILPQANMQILPQLSSISEMLMSVAGGKADIAFVLPSVFEDFNASNPDKLVSAGLDKPLYTYAVSFGIGRDQFAFKSMIDNVLMQMTVSGELEALFKKHDPEGYFEYPQISRKRAE